MCINVYMYHYFRETGFSSFSYYSYFLSPIFFLELQFFSNLLSLFTFCPEVPFRQQPSTKKISLALLAWRKILYLFLVLFVSHLAFYSEIPWADTLIFSYIHRLGPFLVFKILNFNIYFFRKNEFSFGYDKNADIFLGSSQKMM